MRGSLTPEALARVMRGLAVSRKEGILHLHGEGVSKRIYFKAGPIIFAGSDDEQERLGEVLVRAGILDGSDLELALKIMKETGESLGKTIVEMGFTSPADVAAHALERTKSIIRSVFSWRSGTFHFEERSTDVDDEMALQLSTAEMILEAARSIEDMDVVRRGLGDLKAVLRQPANPLLPYEGSVSSSVDWLLYQANGVSTIEEIVAGSPLDEEKTLRSIHALVLAGILEIEAPDKVMAARTEGTKVTGASGTPPPSRLSAPSTHTIPQMLGRYEVERVLGRGAMGAVYLGRDPAIDRTVAIKLIQTAVQLTPSELEKYRERFYREARAAGKLLHPGIITVFDVGHTDEATPFIVMEYVEGRTLQEILNTEKLEPEEVLRLALKILEPLGYAHSRGIVHRDIKPVNILVTPQGDVKIMDFGIAHVVGSELTRADDVLGSPNYMAPEQLSKGAIDARTDLFAFGVVLYRMLTGKLPFTGDSFAAIAKAILFEEPTPPQDLNPAAATAINGIVLRCLSKDAAQRFAGADELKTALVSFSRNESALPDTAMALSSADASRSKGSGSSRWSSTAQGAAGRARDKTPKRFRMVLLAAATVVAVVPLVFLFSSGGPSATESTSPMEVAATSGTPVHETSSARPTDSDITTSENSMAPAEPDPVPETRDAELYHQARVAFERGDLDGSKTALESLLRGSPGFEGAAALLVKVNEQLQGSKRNPAAEAQLFYRARLAFERGELEESKRELEALLEANPSFEGASELLVKIDDTIWKKSLPLSFGAKHNHRIGGCTGTLTLAAWGIRYSSKDHDWRWDFEDIRLLERDGRSILNLETHETDVLSLGNSKNYKFELRTPVRDEDWTRYRRLAR